MISKNELLELAGERNNPCVTISLNTHRTHPDNLTDEITLKNFIKEAKDRVTDEFGKRPTAQLLENLDSLQDQIDRDHNLDSLHVFVSEETVNIKRSIWPAANQGVQISDHFAIRPLIKMHVQEQDYLIMILSQGGVNLYHASDNSVKNEIENEDFPISENPHYITHADKASDGKQVDNMVREYFNKVDKALVNVANQTGLSCVVICTEDNYSRLLQVADNPSLYIGQDAIDYNNTSQDQVAAQAWKIIQSISEKHKRDAISELEESAGQGMLITDLQEIFQASIDGRADLLVMESNFSQSVVTKDERTFDLIEDASIAGAIDDIANTIAWNVLSQNGRVVFVDQNDLTDLGSIALKTRY